MVSSAQTLLSQGAYQLEIISGRRETTTATADWSHGTFCKEALVRLWRHPKYFDSLNDTFYQKQDQSIYHIILKLSIVG